MVTGKVKRALENMKEKGATAPKLKNGEHFVRDTQSVCPECYRILPAVIFERDNKIWIRKECPEHGMIEALYWGDAEMYYRAMDYWVPARDVTGTNVEVEAPCPLSCGYCPAHKNQTALANITVTNRCNLSCWYCFFYAEKLGYVYEPSLQEIRNMIRTLQKQGPFTPNAVQITGGEPTMREDLVQVVKAIKDEGVTHIQLNTNGIKFTQRLLNEGIDAAVEYGKKLKKAGVNTLYLSFDGVTPQSNPKNHWEVPYDLDIFRLAGLHSVVLVPTVVKDTNAHEVGDIIKFASQNLDIIRSVTFQPISMTGSIPSKDRKKHRITIPEVIINIEKQTNGEIPREAWVPITWPYELTDFLENFTGEPMPSFRNHPVCGMGTYIFPETRIEDGHRVVERYVPVTDFVDVKRLQEYLGKKSEELKKGRNKWIVASKLLANLITRFVDSSKAPEGVDMRRLLANILWKRNYQALGQFHTKAIFLGMMHFQDLYNYDIQRVKRCCISYLSPDNRIIPFCAYNVFPDIYRDKLIKDHGLPMEEWKEKHPETVGSAIKYSRKVKTLESSRVYKRAYQDFL